MADEATNASELHHDNEQQKPMDKLRSVRVAAIQMASHLGDVVGNMARADALIQTAVIEHGAKFVVLPEAALHGYLSQDLQQTWHVSGRPLANKIHGNNEPMESFGDLSVVAETVPGPLTEHYCALGKELDAYIVIPFIEKDDLETDAGSAECRYYNSCVLITPSGNLGLTYRKNNLWPLIDNAWATAGHSGAVLDTPYGKVGLAICFDVHVMFDRYANPGNQLWTLLYPIAWVDDLTCEWFSSELPRRIRKAGFHVVGANWSVDQPQFWNGYGYSRVIRRDGTILAEAKTMIGDEIVVADLDY